VRDDAAVEIRRAMNDPTAVMRALHLERGAERQAAGVTVRCPVHDDADPSCSLTRGPDGTLRAKCFACGWAGDVLALTAAVYGLSARRDFPEVLLVAADLGGLHLLASELRSRGARARERPLPPEPLADAPREYPPAAEVDAVWRDAVAVEQDEPSLVTLVMRGLRPGADLARALRGSQALPRWARYRGRTWVETGHRVVLPVYSADLQMRSLRAWHVERRDYDGPKRLPPAGHRASGLCLANPQALYLLAARAVVALLIAEGEPDYLSLCLRYPSSPVLGMGSGMWSRAWAERIAYGSEVTTYFDRDEAGDRYSHEVKSTLARRAIVRRAT
jgi:hypothetical protein